MLSHVPDIAKVGMYGVLGLSMGIGLRFHRLSLGTVGAKDGVTLCMRCILLLGNLACDVPRTYGVVISIRSTYFLSNTPWCSHIRGLDNLYSITQVLNKKYIVGDRYIHIFKPPTYMKITNFILE
jgi:hypothetical protein